MRVIFFLGVLLLLVGCDKYNPINDQIYDLPAEDNLISTKTYKALFDAVKLYPQNPENYYKLALYHLHKDEDSLALNQIRQAIALDSIPSKYQFVLGNAYQRLGQTNKALQAILKAQNDKKENLELLITTGELYFLKKEYDNAIKFFNKALKIAPKDARVYYWKGNIEIARYDSANALKNLNKAIQLKPNFVSAFNSFTELFNKYELYNTAIKYANRGLTIDNADPKLNFNKAEAYRMKRFFEDSATFYYQKTINRDKSFFMASYYLGKYNFDKGNFKNAQKHFESALQYNANLSNTHYYLGLCFKYANKKEQALASFDKVLKLDPKNLSARDMYWAVKNEINQAKLWAREDSIQKAYYKWLEKQNTPKN